MPWVEQDLPAQTAEFLSEDAKNDEDRVDREAFKVRVAKVYFGADEVKLGHSTMSFTHKLIEDSKTGLPMLRSTISFLVERPSGRFSRACYQHTCLEGLTFLDIGRDSNLRGAFCLTLSVPASMSLQKICGKGSLVEKMDDAAVDDFSGIKKNVYVVLKPWYGNMYFRRGKEPPYEFGDYEKLIRAGEFLADIRRRDLDGLEYNKRMFNRDRSPALEYCEIVALKDWVDIVRHDGLEMSEDVDQSNYTYYFPRVKQEVDLVPKNCTFIYGVDPALPSGTASGGHNRCSPPPITRKMITSSPQKTVVMRVIQPSTPAVAPVTRPAAPRVILTHDVRPSTTPARVVVPKASAVTPSTSSATPATQRLNVSTASSNNSTFSPSTSSLQETPTTAESASDPPAAETSTASSVDEEELDASTAPSTAPSSVKTSSTPSSGRNTPSAPVAAAVNLGGVNDSTTLLHYPVRSSENDGITIKFKDMERMSRGEMLNDTIVEFGVRYILYHLLTKEKRAKVHNLSTYFYSSFAAGKQGDKNNHIFMPKNAEKRKEHLTKNYAKVRRWTRKVDIFQKDFIVLPVNSDMHWFLMIVAYPGRAVKDKSEPEVAPSGPEEMCQVFVLDSLRDPDEFKRSCGFPIMRDWLQLEFEDKKGKKEPNLRFSVDHVCPVYIRGLPQQKNLVDCGIYLLAYLEAFLAIKIPTVPEDKTVMSSEWIPWLRVAVIEFYRDKILHRIRSLCSPEIWTAFEAYELHYKSREQAKVTIHKEADLVDLGRRPRRHEDYCCPDKLPVEPTRERAVSLPPTGRLVPGVDRVLHKHT